MEDHIVPNMHSYNKGVFQICRIQGGLLGCGGLHFPGGQDFEEGKALFGIGMYQFYLTSMVNFQKNSPAAASGLLLIFRE